MKKLSILSISLLLSIAVVAQKQINDPNAESRSAKGFHAIRVATGIELFLTQAGSEAVAVSAINTEHRDRIRTVVENGVLKIFYDNDSWKFWKNDGNKKLKAYVSFVNLDGLDASSGSSVRVEGAIKSNKLNLDASSGATFNGKVQVNSLTVDQSSGSFINISGSVGSLTIDGSSGSVFKGYDLTVENCNADMSSGGGAQITVNKELSAEASSGGYVSYKGAGVIKNIKTSSGGSVSKKG